MSSPPDLSALPDFGPAQPLNEIDIGAASAYIGMVIVEIEPLGLLGPEATGWLGPGPNEERVRRMRAAGVPEDQIQMQQMIRQEMAEQEVRGWTLTFVDGKRASVEVHALGEGPFEKIRDECRQVLTNSPAEQRQEDFFAGWAREVEHAPFESYDKGGVVVSQGREHEVSVSSGHYSKETRAAVAAVALRALEG